MQAREETERSEGHDNHPIHRDRTTNSENTFLLHATLYEQEGSRSFRFIVPKLEFGNQRYFG